MFKVVINWYYDDAPVRYFVEECAEAHGEIAVGKIKGTPTAEDPWPFEQETLKFENEEAARSWIRDVMESYWEF